LLCASCGADAGEISNFCPSCGAAVVRAAEKEDYLGRIVAKKYRVEKMIGEGGMGKVYRATQIALDKPVVLKVLRQSLLSDERTVARFQREAKAASRLNHPNSISVLDFGQNDDGALFIAMEFVAGQDLHNILSQEWPLGEARVVRIISQVLSALADAHSAGVIHRDLKPENIMVEQRRGGEADYVKVLDFGIAKIQDSTAEEGPALTRAGFVCGTPEYMSPEQARGGALDARSDLYAVGVILYQLTTGLLPFESDSAVGFATKHLTAEPPPPSKRRPDAKISPAMERLILRALAKEPGARPQSADEFKAELAAVLKGGGRVSDDRVPASATRKVTGPVPETTKASQVTASNVSDVSTSIRPPPSKAAPQVEEVTAATQAPARKWALVALAVLGLSGGAFFVRQAVQPAETPGTAEAPLKPKAGEGGEAESALPLYEQDVPPQERRNTAASLAAKQDGMRAHQRDDLSEAIARYEEAFRQDPTDPDLSLTLGELHYAQAQRELARGWWMRHLKDRPESKARALIERRLANP
jgi:serine/threonine-protein kinase